jgi:hypothetical protein
LIYLNPRNFIPQNTQNRQPENQNQTKSSDKSNFQAALSVKQKQSALITSDYKNFHQNHRHATKFKLMCAIIVYAN